jgi:HTH-type transcriptional regulator / antitoxin HigA
MLALKYKVISSKTQYREYCSVLEHLLVARSNDKNVRDEIDLLTVLIEKWDAEHNSFSNLNPVEVLQSLMNDHHLRAKDLVDILDVSKGYVSDILNYKKGFSKEVIRKLAIYFKVNQAAFNRPYKLKPQNKLHYQ